MIVMPLLFFQQYLAWFHKCLLNSIMIMVMELQATFFWIVTQRKFPFKPELM